MVDFRENEGGEGRGLRSCRGGVLSDDGGTIRDAGARRGQWQTSYWAGDGEVLEERRCIG